MLNTYDDQSCISIPHLSLSIQYNETIQFPYPQNVQNEITLFLPLNLDIDIQIFYYSNFDQCYFVQFDVFSIEGQELCNKIIDNATNIYLMTFIKNTK